METRASYLLVGGFVLVLLVGLVGFVLWLAKFQFDREFTRYDIRFAGTVTGLRVGSSVSYRGIPAGEVVAVGVDPTDVEQVLATIEVSADTPVRTDTVASLELQGITGGVNVLLSGGTQGAAPLEPGPDEERAVIPSQASRLEQFFEGAPELVDNVSALVTQARVLLRPENQANLADTLANLSLLSGALADRVADIQLLINDTAGTMANVRDATAAIEELAVTLNTGMEPLLDTAQQALTAVESGAAGLDGTIDDNREQVGLLISDAREAVNDFNRMTNEIRALTAENREPVLQFTSGTLVEFTTFLAEARGLVAGLNRVATEVERDPARFLFGNQQQGYEAGQ